MAVFPSIRPTGRNYIMGQLPMKIYRGLNGGTVKRVFGNRLLGHTIELNFQNISDANAKLIVDHYNGEYGSYGRFTLPDAVFSGVDNSALLSTLKAPTSIQWEYAEPPAIETVFKGRSTVTVRLVGEIA